MTRLGVKGDDDGGDQLAVTLISMEAEMRERDLEGRLAFGAPTEDFYTARGGAFRMALPEFTTGIHDSQNGVVFSDMAGGFWIVECYERLTENLPAGGPEAVRRRLGEKIRGAIDRFGTACPHCKAHTKNIKYYEDDAYFVCRDCGRSFTPVDLEGSDVYPEKSPVPGTGATRPGLIGASREGRLWEGQVAREDT